MKIEINDNLATVLIIAMVFGIIIFFNYNDITKSNKDSIITTNTITKSNKDSIITTNTITK